MIDFNSIDFRTATNDRFSPYALGVIVVQNGVIKEKKYWQFKPHETVLTSDFQKKEYDNYPNFNEVWPEILPYFENQFIIGHVCSFHISVLRSTLDLYNIPYPSLKFTCSYLFSKVIWKGLISYDIHSLSFANGIEIEETGNKAIDICLFVAGLSILAFKKIGINSMVAFEEKLHVGIGQLNNGSYLRITKNLREIIADTSKQNPDSIFYGKNVVFTGAFIGITRAEAQQILADVGGINQSGVNSKTEYLIVGQQDFRVVGQDGMSGKQEKAAQLLAKGQHIEVLSEKEFFKNL